jgi:uncharacterized membrane protein YhaH (DUF805 family)
VESAPSPLALFLVQIAPAVILSLLMLIPYLRILRRIGRSRWWCVLLFIPFVGWLIVPWTIAFMRWDVSPEAKGTAEVFR